MGQLGSSMMNQNVTDPRQAKWGDLDNSEKLARTFAGAGRGLAGGLNQQPQTGRMGAPSDFAPVPSTPTPMFSTDNWPGGGGPTRKPFDKSVNFYG
jgi:hypothetical protein